VITMYSRSGGKTGAHSWTPACESIGALSYILVQTYQHSHWRQFKITPVRRGLGTIRFAHLPSNSFLVLVPPEDEAVKIFRAHIEIGVRAHGIFEQLAAEKEVLAKSVASLNTVRRKGKSNVNIVDLDEDTGIDVE
ncbi:hypothetical protein B0H10DRAFT_1813588, partial [Mycena sp. CBHHK59/15]